LSAGEDPAASISGCNHALNLTTAVIAGGGRGHQKHSSPQAQLVPEPGSEAKCIANEHPRCKENPGMANRGETLPGLKEGKKTASIRAWRIHDVTRWRTK
jgi:hypothetical protein